MGNIAKHLAEVGSVDRYRVECTVCGETILDSEQERIDARPSYAEQATRHAIHSHRYETDHNDVEVLIVPRGTPRRDDDDLNITVTVDSA